MRTREQIDKQIEGLKAMKTWLPEYSKFGTNNWKAIDAQIDVLNGIASYDDFLEEDDEDSEVLAAASEAEEWLEDDRAEDLFEEKP